MVGSGEIQSYTSSLNDTKVRNNCNFDVEEDVYPETEQHHARRVLPTGLENPDSLGSVLEVHRPEQKGLDLKPTR